MGVGVRVCCCGRSRAILPSDRLESLRGDAEKRAPQERGFDMADGQLVKSKIQQILMENELTVTLAPNGFSVPYDSTAVMINVVEQETRTLVMMYVPVLRQVPPSPELFKYIAIEGQQYFFGSLRYIPDVDQGLVAFEQTLLGDYLDGDELMTALAALANTGNDLDDELQKRFGGKRYVD